MKKMFLFPTLWILGSRDEKKAQINIILSVIRHSLNSIVICYANQTVDNVCMQFKGISPQQIHPCKWKSFTSESYTTGMKWAGIWNTEGQNTEQKT